MLQRRQGHLQLKRSVKESNMFHNYETEKITRKASDTAENLQQLQVEQPNNTL